jgi:predicted TIM-barrel fold metal-dependent hydrolase
MEGKKMNTTKTTSRYAEKPVLNRRGLLCAGMAVAGNALLYEQSVGDDASQGSFIDAHVHVWTPDTKRYPLAAGFSKADMQPRSFTPQELMTHAKPVGVTRVVLIQMSFYRFDNSYMLRVMQDFQGIFSGVAVVDERKEPVAAMRRLATQGVRGFRIRPGDRKPEKWLTGEGMQAMWRCGAEERLAMCHLIDPKFLPSVEEMCRKYPRTPVVIDHFARIGVDGNIRRQDLDNLCRLARFPEVSVKVSAYYALGRKKMPYRDLGPMIRRLRDAFGAERLMWASDCPYQVQGGHTYQASIDLIKHGLGFLTPDEREWILRKTAERVFFS